MRPLLVVAVLLVAAPAHADQRLLELGGGAIFDALGSYDVGRGLGQPARGNDLGPAILGAYVRGALWLSATTTVGGEAGIAIGGLVHTDEKYDGTRASLGGTSTVWAKASFALEDLRLFDTPIRLALDLGAERMAESTDVSTVMLDSVVVGPWLGVRVTPSLLLEAGPQLHVPFNARIAHDSADPTGTFLSVGLRASYLVGIGTRP